jgi:5-bromo-4-chloroindolyl phosphate hydrolysis protein
MGIGRFTGAAGVLSGITGGAAFVVFYLLLGTGILVSLAIAAAAYIGAMLVFSPSSHRMEFNFADGLTPDTVKKAIEEGQAKVAVIKSYCCRITKKDVKDMVEKICHVADQIFENFKKDPKDIKATRKFLSYFLDATTKIIRKYVELSSNQHISQDVARSLEGCDSS